MKQLISKKYKYFVLYIEVFIVICLLPILYNFVPVNKGTRTFYIPSSNIEAITKTLENNGYTVTFIDKLMIQLIRMPKKGWYSVDPNEYKRLFFFEYLYKKQAETMNITVYAGETAKEMVHRLSEDMKLNEKKLYQFYQDHTSFQEGDIVAKQYTIARKVNENTLISYLFANSNKIFEQFQKKYYHKKIDKLSFKTLLIVASIIQKESNSVKEMPAIASVIYNRLNKGMKLQMDSTLNYGIYSHTIITPERIKIDTSHYNTYKHNGLPPLPLGTVTKNALYAAMYPLKSNYLFFMLNEKREHSFAETYKEHLQNIRLFREYQKKRKEEKLKLKKLDNFSKEKEKNSTLKIEKNFKSLSFKKM